MNRKQKGALALAGTVLAGAALFEGFRQGGKRLFKRAFSTKKREVDESCWLFKMPYETMEMKSADGLNLKGYYVPRDNAEFTFVIVHGYHGHAFRMSEYAEAFYETFACDLFLPDLRGHGQSEGDLVGYGWLDKDDVKAWVEKIHELHPERPIVIFGLSMGGGTVNFLADQKMPGVKVLVEDCGYSSLYQELDFQCRQETRLPLLPFYYGVNQQVKKHAGYNVLDADGLLAVSHAKYPMLFIHGLDDDVVPSQMVFDLYNACTTEKQMFFVKATGHADSLKNSKKAYLETLDQFLKEHL